MRNAGFTGWRKSSYSASSGNCVEVATSGHLVGVRDSKQHGGGPVLILNARNWRAFVREAKRGQWGA